MRKFLIFISAFFALVPALRAQMPDRNTMSVAMATVFGDIVSKNLESTRAMGVELNDSLFAARFVQALKGESTGMSLGEANAVMQQVFDHAKQASQADSTTEQAFIETAAKTEGAVMLPSGTVFIVLTEGEGQKPGPDDTAVVTYRGQLSDGSVFDVADQPIDLPVSRLVTGFSEGLQQMLPGGTYRLVIPASAGYGPDGVPGAIPGGATLDFTITLQGVKK